MIVDFRFENMILTLDDLMILIMGTINQRFGDTYVDGIHEIHVVVLIDNHHPLLESRVQPKQKDGGRDQSV